MTTINSRRRVALKSGGSLAVIAAAISAGVLPASAFAEWNKAAFEAKNMNDVLKAMGGTTAEKSGDIVITAPDIAENGAVVPLGVATTLPGVKRLLVLVEKNPSVLSAMFDVSDAVDVLRPRLNAM